MTKPLSRNRLLRIFAAALAAGLFLPPRAPGEDVKGLLGSVADTARQTAEGYKDVLGEVKEAAMEGVRNPEGGDEERDPFVLRGRRLPAVPDQGEGHAGYAFPDLLDLSRITVMGVMRMADGSRAAVVELRMKQGKGESFVVRTGQPMLLSDRDGDDVFCRVREIGEHMMTLALSDGQEVMLPVAGAPEEKKNRGQAPPGGQAQLKGRGK